MRLYERFPGLFRLYHKTCFSGARLLKGVDPEKVVFSCFKGRSYNDNPRFISERLHARRPEAKIVWLFNADAMKQTRGRLPDYVKPVFIDSREAYVELGTARVWVDNFTKDNLLRPARGRQFYIQTWHGDRPIKKICYDAEPNGERRLEEDADRVVTGSVFGERMYRTAFRYRGKYIASGAPRNDALVRNDPAEIRAARAKVGVADDTGLLLYAPTYRDYGTVIPKSAQMDLGRTLDCLERVTGRPWVCMYRAHYKSGGIDLEAVRGRIIDVSGYEEMADLLLAADMVLTDYSSCATDYVLRGDKPALFFIADWEEYTAAHGIYYDIHDTPFMIASNQDALEKLIEGLTPEAIRQNCAEINAYFGTYENGHATEDVCDYIVARLGTAKRLPD